METKGKFIHCMGVTKGMNFPDCHKDLKVTRTYLYICKSLLLTSWLFLKASLTLARHYAKCQSVEIKHFMF